MYSIIQDLSKRINMRLSTALMWSIYGTLLLIISFILGKESVIHNIKNKIQIVNYQDNAQNADSSLNQQTTFNLNTASIGRVYASSKGKKYYIEGICDGNISDKNKVFYKDEKSAMSNGKSKASGCN